MQEVNSKLMAMNARLTDQRAANAMLKAELVWREIQRATGDLGDGTEGPVRLVPSEHPTIAAAVAAAIRDGLVRSAHDASEGGVLVAAIEMAFSGGLGVDLDLDAVPVEGPVTATARAFAEDPSR